MGGDIKEESGRKRYLPVALDVDGMKCLVVGGGIVGTRKTMKLTEYGANVTVVSPVLSSELEKLAESGRISWINEEYRTGHVSGHKIVVAATLNDEVNLQVASDAKELGACTCITSRGESSPLIFPAVCKHGGLTVAVNSDGQNCLASRTLRDTIAKFLEDKDA